MMVETTNQTVGILPVQNQTQFRHAVKRMPHYTVDTRFAAGKVILISRISRLCMLLPNNRYVVCGPVVWRVDRTGIFSGAWDLCVRSTGLRIGEKDSDHGGSLYRSLAAVMEKVCCMIEEEDERLAIPALKSSDAGCVRRILSDGKLGPMMLVPRNFDKSARKKWRDAIVKDNRQVLLSAMKRDIELLRNNPNGLPLFSPDDWSGINVVAD